MCFINWFYLIVLCLTDRLIKWQDVPWQSSRLQFELRCEAVNLGSHPEDIFWPQPQRASPSKNNKTKALVQRNGGKILWLLYAKGLSVKKIWSRPVHKAYLQKRTAVLKVGELSRKDLQRRHLLTQVMWNHQNLRILSKIAKVFIWNSTLLPLEKINKSSPSRNSKNINSFIYSMSPLALTSWLQDVPYLRFVQVVE